MSEKASSRIFWTDWNDPEGLFHIRWWDDPVEVGDVAIFTDGDLDICLGRVTKITCQPDKENRKDGLADSEIVGCWVDGDIVARLAIEWAQNPDRIPPPLTFPVLSKEKE
jgi:hypothetical protein